MMQSAADINWDAEKKSKGFSRVPSQSHKGSSSPEATRFSANRPRVWMRGQAMVELGIVAPIVVVGMLMWTQINQMTSTQHRLMASAYEGTKITSQFTNLYITECLNPHDLRERVMGMCSALISKSECEARFSGRVPEHEVDHDHGEGESGGRLSPEEKEKIFNDLEELLSRKTLCQIMKERTAQAMDYWKLATKGEGSPSYTLKPAHYCKDGDGNFYDECLSIPKNTNVNEFVGVEAEYPKAYALAGIFGVTKHKAKSVTLLRSFRTDSGGLRIPEGSEGCVFGVRTGMSVRYFCGQ